VTAADAAPTATKKTVAATTRIPRLLTVPL
jgi:hypothetical protein